MKGRAPNSPDTGSQTSPSQKPKPNFSIVSIDCRHSSNPMPSTMTTRNAAKKPVPSLKPRSLPLSQLRMIPYETLIVASAACSSLTTSAGSGA